MRNLTRAVAVLALALISLIVGGGIANAVTPIGPWRFRSVYICVQDNTTGDFYPLYVHTAANAYDATPGVGVTYAHGSDCTEFGYALSQVIRVHLIPASQWDQYPCASSYVTTSGGYHTREGRIYYNYWNPSCRPDSIGTDAIANLISKHMGRVLGLALYEGGAGYSVMNTNRFDIRWPTRYDTTNCLEQEGGSGMVRRYNVGCA